MIEYCLFPVAGYGTRFLPVTKSVPKELLPILNKPLIHYAMEEAFGAGIRSFLFINNKDKKSIENYINENTVLEKILSNKPEKELLKDLNKITSECNSHFEYQKEMLGLGHAILQGEKRIARGTFAVILPDDLCHNQGLSIISQLKTLHDKFPDKCIVAVEEVDFSNVERYGIIGGSFIDKEKKIYQVDKMIEKPKTEYAPSNMAIIGRYILTSEVFKKLKAIKKDKRGEIQITNALNALAKEGKVLAYKFDGLRIDCGSVDGFVEANNFFYSLLKK